MSVAFGFESNTNGSTVCMYVHMLHTVPSGTPQDIQYSQSSRDIALLWAPIVCSQCNGPILDYLVEFQSLEDDVVNVAVSANETFTAGGLVPNTNYTFRVAGVNVNGTGPFSSALTILTDEDGKYNNSIEEQGFIQG